MQRSLGLSHEIIFPRFSYICLGHWTYRSAFVFRVPLSQDFSALWVYPTHLITTCLGTVPSRTLTVMALDRYLALRLRFRYCSVVKVHRIAIVLITGWLFGALGPASKICGIKLRQIIGNLVLSIRLMSSSYFYIRTFFSLRLQKLQILGRKSFSLAHYRKSLNSMFFVFCLSVCVRLGGGYQHQGLKI